MHKLTSAGLSVPLCSCVMAHWNSDARADQCWPICAFVFICRGLNYNKLRQAHVYMYTAVNVQLICTFVLAYAKSSFSHKELICALST